MEKLISNDASQSRVVLLYRASTKQQTDSENDIPLQRNILRPWADLQGKFIREFVEGGVSGFKVSASKRDSIIEIKAMADRQEFDILGVYMSDRLGRIADETPLIVSYLNARDIKVISFCEGEISSKTHADKLLTYIRYWQAEGESLKTSQRVKDAVEQNVKQGKWRGGNPPYGYKTISNGTLNFKGRPIFDVVIDPETSDIVKNVFELYKRHYGLKGIAKYLNDRNVPACKGGLWEHRQILNVLKNKLYIGIYELGKTSKVRMTSPIMEHLGLISEQDFYEVQDLLMKNSNSKFNIKRPTLRGSRILTGLLFCECGRKYTSQIYRYSKKRKNNMAQRYERTVYRCDSYRSPKEGQCDKKALSSDMLEQLIVDDAKKLISELDIERLLRSQINKLHHRERKINDKLDENSQKKTCKEKELYDLKEKISRIILEGSRFPEELFLEIIETKKMELNTLQQEEEKLQRIAFEILEQLSANSVINSSFDNWASRFDLQDMMGKKSMLINIIDKITVMDHNITVAYKISLTNLCCSLKHSQLVKMGEHGKIPTTI